MKRTDFLNKFIETVEIEQEINEETLLENISEWDSLANITTLTLLKKLTGLNIGASSIKKCITVKDLLDLGNEKYE